VTSHCADVECQRSYIGYPRLGYPAANLRSAPRKHSPHVNYGKGSVAAEMTVCLRVFEWLWDGDGADRGSVLGSGGTGADRATRMR
jgi:hypothetical protein